MSEIETNRWIAVVPGYQQPKDSEVVLVTVRRGDRRWVQSARALLRGPAAIGFWHTPDSDRPGEWIMGVIGWQPMPEPMQDGEVVNA